MSVSITFLGGLGEIGRNCAVLEVGGKLALIDCGLMFPEEDMLGVDLVLPDFSFVLERAADVSCVVLTHGHEDHVGALAYFLREVNVPVYGTALTVELARSRVEELGVAPDMHAVEPGEWVGLGPIRFALVRVAHSVPQAAGVVFDTEEGLVVHSGDFKLDPKPIDGIPTDLNSFAGFGRMGVRLLLADSTNAERAGFTPSESTLGAPLRELTAQASGRVIIACFASHVHRVQQAIDAIVGSGRKLAFLGRSMLRNTEVTKDLGLLNVPEDAVRTIEELRELPPNQTAVICTGSQGEPFAALSLMAQGEHRWITLESDDTVIISATPIPGNETKVSRVINNLVRLGVTVHHGRNANVHVSGHAAQDELLTFINVLAPQAFVPVHGEYRHLRANAALAASVGVPEIEVCEDGDRVVLEGGAIRVERAAAPHGYVYLDGHGIGDVEGVLRDRRHLADDGVLIVTVGVDMGSGEIVIGPDVDGHGVTDDMSQIDNDIAERVIEVMAELSPPFDPDAVRRRVRSASGKVVRKALNRRPVVIPILIEA
ncbi:MAG TPA: ribonuclease J [Acidimicrobiia bacterium]|jgi:ribonuclease J|nr:ribonuclease J [Acidimicrobiia bacterium]